MNSITAAVLMKSLDGLMLRAEVTAQNIANAGTTGYHPQRVTFEAALAEATPRGIDAISALVPNVRADSAFQPGDALRLDLEMAEAASTSGRYAALVELLNRHAQIAALAVSSGR